MQQNISGCRCGGRKVLPAFTLLLFLAACGDGGSGPDTRSGFQFQTSTPEQEGLDPTRLDGALREIEDSLPNVKSFLIVRNGKIVLEKYFNGNSASNISEIHSIAKTFVSTFIGLALDRGWIDSLDQPISTVLPEYFTDIDDPRKRRITIRQLSTMTSGIAFESNVNLSPNSPDWVQEILNAPLESTPVRDTCTTEAHGGNGPWWQSSSFFGSRIFLAIGYREQYIVVLPDLDIVVVIQSESAQPRGPIVDHLHLVPNFVVPSAMGVATGN